MIRRVPSRPALVLLLAAMAAAGPLASDMYVPSLGGVAESYDASPGQVQLTLTVFLVAFAVGHLIVGPASDILGRRPVVLGGLVVFVLSGVLCVLASSLGVLMCARGLQGAAASVGPVIARAVVRDLFGVRTSASVLAYVGGATSLAPAVAPVIGGMLAGVGGWRASFVFLAAYGVVVIAWSSLRLPETRSARPTDTVVRSTWRSYRAVLSSRAFCESAVTLGVVYGGFYAYVAMAPYLLAERFGLSPRTLGLSFGLIIMGYVAGSVSSDLFARRGHLGPGLTAGRSLVLLSAAALLAQAAVLTITAPLVIATMMLYMMGYGLLVPALTARALAPFAAGAGAAAAMLGFAEMTLAGIGSAVAALFSQTFVAMAGLVFGCALLATWVSRPHRSGEADARLGALLDR